MQTPLRDTEELYEIIMNHTHAILHDEEADLIELAEAIETLDTKLKAGKPLPGCWNLQGERN